MATFIGEDLVKRTTEGGSTACIATVFPQSRTIVTIPGIHAAQRFAYIQALNQSRQAGGDPPLSDDEQDAQMLESVDLFVDGQTVIIRPDPLRMDLAYEADELLQEIVPKRLIRYLLLSDRRVRESLKKHGECWRMFLPPTEPREIRRMISESRSAIEGRSIYYYSPATGTRILTFESFRSLGELDDAELSKHLSEIAIYMNRRNRTGRCEIEFFMAGQGISTVDLERAGSAEPQDMRQLFQQFCDELLTRIPCEYRHDDLDEPEWRSRMFARLMTHRDDVIVDDQQAMGLDSDFSMRVEWLPGGRIEEGELIIDPALEEPYGQKKDRKISSVVHSLILNLVQEYGDLEYINLGSVLPSPRRNEARGGRREVYVAQIKQRGIDHEVLQIVRMQKWGVRERLDEGKSLEEAMIEAEEYTEYIMDRRLACRQLGMNLPGSQSTRKVSEIYDGRNKRYSGVRVWTPYFQRDYIRGVATDQVPARKLADASYARMFARLLGRAAASNIVLGRAELTGEAVFDVGDEIIVEENGMPDRLIVSDHVGAFVDWTGRLEDRAVGYAAPVTRRLGMVANRAEFIDAYISGFSERFVRLKEEYNKHSRSFDTLYKYRPWDPRGSMACRWHHLLQRLRAATPHVLADLMRKHIGN